MKIPRHYDGEWPGRQPRGLRDEWFGVGWDDGWLEVRVPHAHLRIGPLTVHIGAYWQRDWRPRRWWSKRKRYQEWLRWCQSIHTNETPEQHRSRARMLSNVTWFPGRDET